LLPTVKLLWIYICIRKNKIWPGSTGMSFYI